MRLSVITTLYGSATFLPEFVERMTRAAARLTDDFELILVNDGSPDDSLMLARGFADSDGRICVINLSRNFGHHSAMLAGLSHANGDLIFLIDVDLEEPPEQLLPFHEAMKTHAADVVYGVQRARAGGWFRRLSGEVFYRLFNLLSDMPIPRNVCTVRLMSRRFVDALLSLRDRNLFLAGNFAWTGFSQFPVTIDKSTRPSASSYTLARKLKLFVNAITSYSSYPLYLLFCVGASICSASSAYVAYLLIHKLVYPETVLMGWASVMASIWLIGGIIILSISIVALYIGRIFNEVKDRPRYIIEAVHRGTGLRSATETNSLRENGERSASEVGSQLRRDL